MINIMSEFKYPDFVFSVFSRWKKRIGFVRNFQLGKKDKQKEIARHAILSGSLTGRFGWMSQTSDTLCNAVSDSSRWE